MLVLSRKCGNQLRIPEEGITLNVVEISGQRVCLGMVPPAGQPLDLREDDATDPFVPEVEFTERGYQVLVWASPGAGLRINERVQVRVVTVDADSVCLGLVAPPGRGRAAGDSLRLNAGPVGMGLRASVRHAAGDVTDAHNAHAIKPGHNLRCPALIRDLGGLSMRGFETAYELRSELLACSSLQN